MRATSRNLHPGVVVPLLLLLLSTSLVGQTRERIRDAQREGREAFRRYALDHPGSAAAGLRLYNDNGKLVCTDCHRITGLEKSGPNLDGIADKYSRADLIQHILEPSRFIQPGYERVTILTKAGRTFSGRIARASKVECRLLDAKGKQVTIARENIEAMEASMISLMPDNVVASVTAEQFADLIAYLETLHSSALTGFRGKDDPVEIRKLAKEVSFRPIHPPNQKFGNPVWCGAIPGAKGQLAVAEHQEARIWRVVLTADKFEKHLFLDLSAEVSYGTNQGLMCVAFHPDYVENGRYFLKHEVKEQGVIRTTVVERRAADDRLRDSGSRSRRLLHLEQPAFNHNGGCIAFGTDNLLYIAFGDGGPQLDPPGYSQNPRIFHGSMLRIDVDRRDPGLPYAIPADNPYVDAHRLDPEIRAETWAVGFREPWRFSFDPATGDLWVGDVGQSEFEEVCLVHRGDNHGWNVYEAYEPFSDEYRRDGARYTAPVFAYPHRFGVSVTGGHVYRGQRSPSFVGAYIFGDYESRRVWAMKQKAGRLESIIELGRVPEHIASFGTDDAGNIYVVGYEGTIFAVDLSESRYAAE